MNINSPEHNGEKCLWKTPYNGYLDYIKNNCLCRNRHCNHWLNRFNKYLLENIPTCEHWTRQKDQFQWMSLYWLIDKHLYPNEFTYVRDRPCPIIAWAPKTQSARAAVREILIEVYIRLWCRKKSMTKRFEGGANWVKEDGSMNQVFFFIMWWD